jgi:PAS domain S-box-containing protein
MKSIKVKLLIFIGIIVLIFSAILMTRTQRLVASNVENLTNQKLALALDFNLAIREYVAETIRPLMFKLVDKGVFIPEAMSTSYVSHRIFEKVRKKYPDFIIKFSSGNPRNPINQAGTEELNIIRYFNEHPQDARWAGDIGMDGKQYLAMFSAMRMEKTCLRCHGNPADAPIELIKRYGPDASFYLPLGKVVGMDTIAVPSDTIKGMLSKEKIKNIEFIGLLILLLSASLVFVFKFVITDRLSRITRHFFDSQRQSEDLTIKSIEVKGEDEIAELAESFNNLSEKLNNTYTELRRENDERKFAQKALLESEEKYRKLFDMESDALALVDVETGNMLDVNRAFIKLYGYTKEEILCMKKKDFSADPDETVKSIQNGEIYVPTRYHKKKSGTVFPVEITGNYYEQKGRKINLSAIRDITDRKVIEEQIQTSLREKELLLSEIHHRVKNNFEIISSIFNLSSINCENQEIKDLLLTSRNRIHSMAMIHSQLYQSDRFDRINMEKQIKELAGHLSSLYRSEKRIHLKIASSEVYLSISQAIPCALILNELITNSLKYAFTDREQGKIEISIHKSADNAILLRVKDDGVGISDRPDVTTVNGLGLELVKHLVAGQLNGEIRFDNADGTDICIEFNA